MIEEWRQLPEWPIFEVSNLGQVRNTITNRILAQYNGYHDYKYVVLYHKGTSKNRPVHRLVATTFLEASSKEYVLHKDGDKANNTISNLEYSDSIPSIEARNKYLAQLGQEKAKKLRDQHLSDYIVDPSTGCWEWQGSKDWSGYGIIKRFQKTIKAHRFFYESLVGEIPHGLLVCHSCDNTSCVNPAHLWVGTCADNHKDKSKKGRTPRTQLTSKQAIEIRNSTLRTKDLAIKYNVSVPTISNIKARRIYKYAEEAEL